MTYFAYLIRTAFTKNPIDKWKAATTAERVALLLIGILLVADMLTLNALDMVLDVLLILTVFVFIRGENEDAG